MKTQWFCIKCKQPLTIKWNTQLHCDNKHDGLFEFIIPFSAYLMKYTSLEDNKISDPNI